jgi:hypothetical protein
MSENIQRIIFLYGTQIKNEKIFDSFCIFTPRLAKMYFLGMFDMCQLICAWILVDLDH